MRGLRLFCSIFLVAVLVATNLSIVAAKPARLTVVAPRNSVAGQVTALRLKLPSGAAAVDGRLIVDPRAAELIGVAVPGQGTSFAPVALANGYAFGAYGMRGGATLHLVVLPRVSGRIGMRVLIDSAANVDGGAIKLASGQAKTTLKVGNTARTWRVPNVTALAHSNRPAGAIRGLTGASRLGRADLDVLRSSWESRRLNSQSCSTAATLADANGDGCVDIVDAQALLSRQALPAAPNPFVQSIAPSSSTLAAPDKQAKAAAATAFARTFVVNSTADTADASAGNGICADSQGRCTLRAAITETNWSRGEDLIQFNLSGTAPVRIRLNSVLPHLNDRTGGATIDGYSQPGSRVNSSTFGSNAIMGVELVGTGNSPRDNILRITSSGNTVRGLLLNTAYRPIAIAGTDAANNHVVGNWIGFDNNGAPASYYSYDAVYLDGGAHDNVIGTPDLADRNVIGNSTKAIFLYGPGTNDTIIQNNVLCMTPSGMSTAMCYTGIDHDFGPKNSLIGGSAAGERNYFGGTYLNGVEVSHGWDPNGSDTSTKWQVNGHRVIGNWIGFRGDGSYSANFRSGRNAPGNGDNGNAINIYDGANNNLAEGNYIASGYDGVRLGKANASNNTVRNNVIGESPQGQAAPMAWWGVRLVDSTSDHLIEGNIIRNAANGGIGLVHTGIRRVRITRNVISDTNGPAIYLRPTANGSTGANNLYPAPVISSATTLTVTGTGLAKATVEVYRASLGAGQSGLPIEYLGSGTVAANGTWSINVSIAANQRVTALQIAPNGNTSALGSNVTASFQAPPNAPVANFSATQQQGNRTVDFGDTSSNSPTAWSWDFGDGASSSAQNPSHTFASAGTYPVKLTVTNAGGSDSKTSQITVNDPPAGTVYAADSFDRTATNGWGSANVGGAYTLTGTAANFDVAAGTGTIRVPTKGTLRSALLNGVTARDIDINVTLSVDKLPAGANHFVYLVSRRVGSSEYRPRLRIAADGSVYVSASRVVNGTESPFGTEVKVAGLNAGAGAVIRVHAQVSGASPTTVRVKAWANGSAEPAAWQYTGNDSTAALQSVGSVGLRAYVGGNASNAPHVFTFDDYTVRAP